VSERYDKISNSNRLANFNPNHGIAVYIVYTERARSAKTNIGHMV